MLIAHVIHMLGFFFLEKQYTCLVNDKSCYINKNNTNLYYEVYSLTSFSFPPIYVCVCLSK